MGDKSPIYILQNRHNTELHRTMLLLNYTVLDHTMLNSAYTKCDTTCPYYAFALLYNIQRYHTDTIPDGTQPIQHDNTALSITFTRRNATRRNHTAPIQNNTLLD